MKARIANSQRARCGGGCPPRRTYTREGERCGRAKRGRRRKEEKTEGRREKGGRKEGKEDEFRKKVHKFSFRPITKMRERKLFLEKRCEFETKDLSLRLIKHNFPFLPAALRRPYSAKSWGYPNESAQMLFDLLKKNRYSAVWGASGRESDGMLRLSAVEETLDESGKFGQLVGYVGTERAVAVTHGSVEPESTVGKQENAVDQLIFALSVTTGVPTKLCNTATAASTLATFLMRM